MRALELVPPSGCALTPADLATQRSRAKRLALVAVEVARIPDGLLVTFAEHADPGLVSELVATERSCCSFLGIDYDEGSRRLSIVATDEQGREVVARFRTLFEAERVR